MAQREIVTRWIVDPEGAVKGSETAATAVERGTQRIEQSSRRMDQSVSKSFGSMDKVAGGLKTSLDASRGSLRGFEKGLAVASVASGSLTTSLSGAVREVLLTGTALGVMGGAISAAGLGLGYLGRVLFSESEATKRYRERLEENTKSAEERAASLVQQARDMDRELRRSRGIDLVAEDVAKLDAEYAKLEKRLARLARERAEASASRGFGAFLREPITNLIGRAATRSPETIAAEESQLQRQQAALKEQRDAIQSVSRLTNDALKQTLKLEAEQTNRLAAATTEAKKFAAEMQGLRDRLSERAEPGNKGFIDAFVQQLERARDTRVRNTFAEQSRSIAEQNALLRERDPLKRQLLAITQEEERAERRIYDLAGDRTSREKQRLQFAIDENARRRRQELVDAPFESLAQSGAATFEQTLGDAVVNGINGRTDDVRAIFQSWAGSVQRMFAQAILEAFNVKQGAVTFLREVFGIGAQAAGTDPAVSATSGNQAFGPDNTL